ncbi:hypothetical protein ACFOZ0_30235 [Streptomyces yaanensis]|uniref:Uncharacterized protein n=1 Tax=Streptomyces yaanensis TaxID=1142239 RepID=A0ABV7SKI4_9ACTN|nr:hypothetical protein [Streptomyces sp. CGMCC 4.7035]WNC00390.1 hypothetical protein Q2K21_21300 [Streptomyces sp. CGMCC 4.7035]
MTGELERPEGWGDLHQIRGLFDQGLRRLVSKDVRYTIRAGRGGLDETAALFTGEADIAVVTPAAALRLLYRFGDLKGLFALGVIPRRGSLVVAADATLGLDAVADLATHSARITVATCADDGVSLVGFAVHRALRMAGVGGGDVDFVYDEHPAARYASGAADVVIHDPMATPDWRAVVAERQVRYLPWGDRVLHGFAAQGWLPRIARAGQLPPLIDDLPALDCSDFAVLCRADLDEGLARLTARYLARGCCPAEAAAVARTPLPLHPGAARAYAELVADEAVADVSLGSR